MPSYQQLSLVERSKIKALQLQGLSNRSIGKCLGRSHTTIGRELNRNRQGHSEMSGYVPELADQLSKRRKMKASQRPRLKNDEVRDFVHAKLKERWTPEQIAGALPSYLPGNSMTHEAIYQYIYSDY